MSYEFDEIKFLRDEGSDWWETIKKVPVKILDQDFGTEVSIQDLVESTRDKKPEETKGASSLSTDKKDVPDSEKKLEVDSIKRPEGAVKKTGYSKVLFGKEAPNPGKLDEGGKPEMSKEWFEVEIFSTQFKSSNYNVKVEKGFLVIFATSVEAEGDSTVWRKFERRYMLPHDCYFSNYNQVEIQLMGSEGPRGADGPGGIDKPGGIKVIVYKKDPSENKRSPGKHPALKPPGRSPSPLKSPPRDKEKATGRSPPAQKTPPRDKEKAMGRSPPAQKTPPRDKEKATGRSPPAQKTPPRDKEKATGRSPPAPKFSPIY